MIIKNRICEKGRVDSIIHCERGRSFRTLSEREIKRISRESEVLYEKPEQVAKALVDEQIGLECVQAYISNMSTSSSLEELDNDEGYSLPEVLLNESSIEWTAPKWAKAGDIVFFMHSKYAKSTITRLRTELIQRKNEYSSADYNRLMSYLYHALEIHAKYGGKIFAIGRVCGCSEYVEPENYCDILHWKSRNYAEIDNIQELDEPIDISDFHNYIYVTRAGAITPLFNNEFDLLRSDIGKTNDLPDFVQNASAKPMMLRQINDENWVEIANAYRRCFILEKQFRQFYVDYFIRAIGDKKTFYTECRCCRPDINDSFMDYVMRFDGKLLPVEVKLSVAAEPNIKSQVGKYVYNSRVFLDVDEKRSMSGDMFHPGKVLIIDTEKVYIYNAKTNSVDELFDLDRISSISHLEDAKKLIHDAVVS
jgi:hypothetical protein